MLNGYKEAETIDRQLNSLAAKYIINKENAREWITLVRTLNSSLRIILYEATRVLDLKGGERNG